MAYLDVILSGFRVGKRTSSRLSPEVMNKNNHQQRPLDHPGIDEETLQDDVYNQMVFARCEQVLRDMSTVGIKLTPSDFGKLILDKKWTQQTESITPLDTEMKSLYHIVNILRLMELYSFSSGNMEYLVWKRIMFVVADVFNKVLYRSLRQYTHQRRPNRHQQQVTSTMDRYYDAKQVIPVMQHIWTRVLSNQVFLTNAMVPVQLISAYAAVQGFDSALKVFNQVLDYRHRTKPLPFLISGYNTFLKNLLKTPELKNEHKQRVWELYEEIRSEGCLAQSFSLQLLTQAALMSNKTRTNITISSEYLGIAKRLGKSLQEIPGLFDSKPDTKAIRLQNLFKTLELNLVHNAVNGPNRTLYALFVEAVINRVPIPSNLFTKIVEVVHDRVSFETLRDVFMVARYLRVEQSRVDDSVIEETNEVDTENGQEQTLSSFIDPTDTTISAKAFGYFFISLSHKLGHESVSKLLLNLLTPPLTGPNGQIRIHQFLSTIGFESIEILLDKSFLEVLLKDILVSSSVIGWSHGLLKSLLEAVLNRRVELRNRELEELVTRYMSHIDINNDDEESVKFPVRQGSGIYRDMHTILAKSNKDLTSLMITYLHTGLVYQGGARGGEQEVNKELDFTWLMELGESVLYAPLSPFITSRLDTNTLWDSEGRYRNDALLTVYQKLVLALIQETPMATVSKVYHVFNAYLRRLPPYKKPTDLTKFLNMNGFRVPLRKYKPEELNSFNTTTVTETVMNEDGGMSEQSLKQFARLDPCGSTMPLVLGTQVLDTYLRAQIPVEGWIIRSVLEGSVDAYMTVTASPELNETGSDIPALSKLMNMMEFVEQRPERALNGGAMDTSLPNSIPLSGQLIDVQRNHWTIMVIIYLQHGYLQGFSEQVLNGLETTFEQIRRKLVGLHRLKIPSVNLVRMPTMMKLRWPRSMVSVRSCLEVDSVGGFVKMLARVVPKEVLPKEAVEAALKAIEENKSESRDEEVKEPVPDVTDSQSTQPQTPPDAQSSTDKTEYTSSIMTLQKFVRRSKVLTQPFLQRIIHGAFLHNDRQTVMGILFGRAWWLGKSTSDELLVDDGHYHLVRNNFWRVLDQFGYRDARVLYTEVLRQRYGHRLSQTFAREGLVPINKTSFWEFIASAEMHVQVHKGTFENVLRQEFDAPFLLPVDDIDRLEMARARIVFNANIRQVGEMKKAFEEFQSLWSSLSSSQQLQPDLVSSNWIPILQAFKERSREWSLWEFLQSARSVNDIDPVCYSWLLTKHVYELYQTLPGSSSTDVYPLDRVTFSFGDAGQLRHVPLAILPSLLTSLQCQHPKDGKLLVPLPDTVKSLISQLVQSETQRGELTQDQRFGELFQDLIALLRTSLRESAIYRPDTPVSTYWPESAIVTFNKVLGYLATKGEFERSRQVLNDMRSLGMPPTSVSYNHILSVLAQSTDSETHVVMALELLDEMRVKNVIPDIVTLINMSRLLRGMNVKIIGSQYPHLFPTLPKSLLWTTSGSEILIHVSLIRDIYTRFMQSSSEVVLPPEQWIWKVYFFARALDLDTLEAELSQYITVHSKSKEQIVSVYQAVLTGLSDVFLMAPGSEDLSLEQHQNLSNLRSIVKEEANNVWKQISIAKPKSRRLPLTPKIYYRCIDVFGKCGDVPMMVHVLEEYIASLQKNQKPDMTILDCAFRGFVLNGDVERAESIMKDIVEYGMQPSVQSTVRFLRQVGKTGDMEKVVSIYREFSKPISEQQKSSVSSVDHLRIMNQVLKIFTACKPEDFDEVQVMDWVNSVYADFNRFRVYPDTKSFTYLISISARAGAFDSMDYYLGEFSKTSYQMNTEMFAQCLRSLSVAPRIELDTALGFFESCLNTYSVAPDVSCFVSMFRIFSRLNEFERAFQFIQTIMVDKLSMKPNLEMFVQLARGAVMNGNEEMLKRIVLTEMTKFKLIPDWRLTMYLFESFVKQEKFASASKLVEAVETRMLHHHTHDQAQDLLTLLHMYTTLNDYAAVLRIEDALDSFMQSQPLRWKDSVVLDHLLRMASEIQNPAIIWYLVETFKKQSQWRPTSDVFAMLLNALLTRSRMQFMSVPTRHHESMGINLDTILGAYKAEELGTSRRIHSLLLLCYSHPSNTLSSTGETVIKLLEETVAGNILPTTQTAALAISTISKRHPDGSKALKSWKYLAKHGLVVTEPMTYLHVIRSGINFVKTQASNDRDKQTEMLTRLTKFWEYVKKNYASKRLSSNYTGFIWAALLKGYARIGDQDMCSRIATEIENIASSLQPLASSTKSKVDPTVVKHDLIAILRSTMIEACSRGNNFSGSLKWWHTIWNDFKADSQKYYSSATSSLRNEVEEDVDVDEEGTDHINVAISNIIDACRIHDNYTILDVLWREIIKYRDSGSLVLSENTYTSYLEALVMSKRFDELDSVLMKDMVAQGVKPSVKAFVNVLAQLRAMKESEMSKKWREYLKDNFEPEFVGAVMKRLSGPN